MKKSYEKYFWLFAFVVAASCLATPSSALAAAGQPVIDGGIHVGIGTNLGQLAPNFTLPDVSGSSVTLSELQGQQVLLVFGSTHCPYCAARVPLLNELDGDDLKVIFVLSGGTVLEANRYVADKGIAFDVLLDRSHSVARRYMVRRVPEVFLIDIDGVIAYCGPREGGSIWYWLAGEPVPEFQDTDGDARCANDSPDSDDAGLMEVDTAFYSQPEDENWNHEADIVVDEEIDVFDLVSVWENFEGYEVEVEELNAVGFTEALSAGNCCTPPSCPSGYTDQGVSCTLNGLNYQCTRTCFRQGRCGTNYGGFSSNGDWYDVGPSDKNNWFYSPSTSESSNYCYKYKAYTYFYVSDWDPGGIWHLAAESNKVYAKTTWDEEWNCMLDFMGNDIDVHTDWHEKGRGDSSSGRLAAGKFTPCRGTPICVTEAWGIEGTIYVSIQQEKAPWIPADYIYKTCSGSIACTSASHCGTDRYVGSPYCSSDDVYQNYRAYYCLNPGQCSASCGYTDTPIKQGECGTDSCGSWGSNYCMNDDVYHSRTCYDRGCSGGSCFENSSQEEEMVQECGEDSCGSWGNWYCSSPTQRKRDRTCHDRGCSGNSCFDTVDTNSQTEICQYGCSNGQCIGCPDECSSGETRCEGDYQQTCGDYDSDTCLEWPSSTSGSGNDDCSDCSCSCGGYDLDESVANGNCNDGKDNDCDGFIDGDDPGCGATEPDIDSDGMVNFADFAILASRWLNAGCGEVDSWCDGADVDYSGAVNLEDLRTMAEHWLEINMFPIDDFESGDLSSWSFGGDTPWVISSDEKNNGDYAASSGVIIDDQWTYMYKTQDVPRGYISFARKVSSEYGYDWFVFYIDGEAVDIAGGDSDWKERQYFVNASTHDFYWSYQKDSSVSEGSDRAWVDDIVFYPQAANSEVCSWAELRAYKILGENMSIEPGEQCSYVPVYETWVIGALDGGFTGTFNCPTSGQYELRVTHQTSASASCPGGGYAPVTISVNGSTVVSNYDPAENHGGTHGSVTDSWTINANTGSNAFEWIANDLCTNYWIQKIEILFLD